MSVGRVARVDVTDRLEQLGHGDRARMVAVPAKVGYSLDRTLDRVHGGSHGGDSHYGPKPAKVAENVALGAQ